MRGIGRRDIAFMIISETRQNDRAARHRGARQGRCVGRKLGIIEVDQGQLKSRAGWQTMRYATGFATDANARRDMVGASILLGLCRHEQIDVERRYVCGPGL